MIRTESHTITSKGYAPLDDPDEYDLDYPLEARTRSNSLSILSPRVMNNKYSSRFRSRRSQRSRLIRELSESLTRVRESSPPPAMYRRTNSEMESNSSSSGSGGSSRRAVQFTSSWEGVLEDLDDAVLEPLRFRVSVN